MLKKLICKFRGHNILKVIDKADLHSDAFGVYGEIQKSHRECRRCGLNIGEGWGTGPYKPPVQ